MYIFVLAFLLCIAQGEVYVDSTSNCGNSCSGTTTSPFLTLLDALGSFQSGGTVIVNDGVYTGQGNKNINISTGITIKSMNGPENAIIDCEGDGYGFDLFSGPFYVTGITIRNCYRKFQNPNYAQQGSYGGGALSIHSTYTVLTNVRLENNNATGLGGAIFIYSDSVEIYNSTITNNQVKGVGGGIYIQSANLKIGNSTTIRNNEASQNGTDIFCISAAVEILDSASAINSATCESCSITNAENKNICPAAGMSIRISWVVVLMLLCFVMMI